MSLKNVVKIEKLQVNFFDSYFTCKRNPFCTGELRWAFIVMENIIKFYFQKKNTSSDCK